MADLSALFNSPPGPSRPPPLRTPSPSPSPSGSPRRRSSQPLFISPNGTATPIRPRPDPNARYNFEPEIDPFEEDSNYRSGGYTNGLGAGGEESVITGQLGNYDPLAPVLGAEEDEPGRKKRRVMPKIDAERLMSDHGLPALMRDAKRFKVRGKGHEGDANVQAQDLKSLLSTYQIWAHRMFPRGDFMGTMNRVENVLRTRRMENAMKGYRDVFHPPPPSPEHNDQDLNMDRDTHLTPPPMSQEPYDHLSSGNAYANANDNGNRNEDRGDEPLFDEADLDEMAAMEEMEREQESRSRTMQGGTGTGTGDDEPPVLEEEDEWEGLYD